jgi:hypothetical protein
VVVDLTPAETNDPEQENILEEDLEDNGVAGNLEEEPVAVGMWGAL